MVALLGRNGAGKSTTLKAIMGLVRAARARCVSSAGEIGAGRPTRIARSGLGYVPEDRRIFTELTVEENLEVGRQPPRDERAALDAREALRALSQSRRDARSGRAGAMSGGEQQMLTIARTLMGNPLLLLLDEPSEGLAPLIVEQMAQAILELKGEGL